jgi:hypothetical protein
MQLDTRLEPNETNIAAKVLDGEAILINLSTGFYYSMDGSGGILWSLIDARYTPAEMVDALARIYALTPDQARGDVDKLIGELENHNLVRPSSAAQASRISLPENPGAYAAPVLNVYGDMNHLLAIDPPLPGLYGVPDQGQKSE